MKMNLDMIHSVLVILLVVNLLLLVNLTLKNSNSNSNCGCGKDIANKVKSCNNCEGCGN